MLKGKVFGFPQVDIDVPDKLYDKFSEMEPVFFKRCSERTPNLFKTEYVGTKDVWLTTKCYLVQDQNKIVKNKYTYR